MSRHGIISIIDESGQWRWNQRHYQYCRKNSSILTQSSGSGYTIAGTNIFYFGTTAGAANTYESQYNYSSYSLNITFTLPTGASAALRTGNAATANNSRILIYTGDSLDSNIIYSLGDTIDSTISARSYMKDWTTHDVNIYDITNDEDTGSTAELTVNESGGEFNIILDGLNFDAAAHFIQFNIPFGITDTTALREYTYTATLTGG